MRESDKNDFNVMNDLNSRFLNFLNLVKSETKRNELLEKNLAEQKQDWFNGVKERHGRYYDELVNNKRLLNELCLSLSNIQVKERHNRIIIDWFSNMIKFEMDNYIHLYFLLLPNLFQYLVLVSFEWQHTLDNWKINFISKK